MKYPKLTYPSRVFIITYRYEYRKFTPLCYFCQSLCCSYCLFYQAYTGELGSQQLTLFASYIHAQRGDFTIQLDKKTHNQKLIVGGGLT